MDPVIAKQYTYIVNRLRPPLYVFFSQLLPAFVISFFFTEMQKVDIIPSIKLAVWVAGLITGITLFLNHSRGKVFAQYVEEKVNLSWNEELTHVVMTLDQRVFLLPLRVAQILTQYETNLPTWFLQRLERLLAQHARETKKQDAQ